ncbi:hypothetical protein J3R82DRAFT_10115 [Butyriboletus roseoflavus]|nr:hypothetical protein J3R82DRAFT_10115 [Butyriboletus roseoflavus]
MATKRLFSVPHFLRRSRHTTPPASSMHRCFLISEIFCLILEFIRQSDESPEEGECWEDCTIGKRTLASVARTCRAFSAPALDLLWMRLDSLDPLIKVLPSRLWAKKHSRFVVRMFMGDKQWSTFHKYAVRVHFLRGPCCGIPPSIQRNVVTALARCSRASLPLLPNLTELVWNESDTYSVIDPTVSLIKYFAGPRVATISLFLVSWPIYVSARAVLADLPNICPNVTSFTAIPRATLNDHSPDIGDIVSKWSNLRVLRTCALSQAVMDELASKETLNTLSIELNTCVTDLYVKKLPSMVHTFSLEGSNALHCIRYLQMLHGNPTHFRLHVGLDVTLPSDMDALFQMLPMRLDTTQLRHLTITLRSSFRRALTLHSSFPLTEPILASLYAFSSLVTLDMNAFCASELDDAAYERMAGAWPELRSLKVGAADVSRMKPVASVGAVIAVLRSCPCLETLHIVFDGAIAPPPPTTALDVDEGTQRGKSAGGGEAEKVGVEGVEGGKEERVTMSRTCSWGISNQYMTEIHVGHSPAGEDMEGLKNLASCLRSVMPRLGRIQSIKDPLGMLGMFDMAESEGWRTVQRLLVDSKDLPLKIDPPDGTPG